MVPFYFDRSVDTLCVVPIDYLEQVLNTFPRSVILSSKSLILKTILYKNYNIADITI